MATVTARVRVEIAGRTVPGFPLTLTFDADSFQTADFVRLFGDSFADFPASHIDEIKLFLAQALNTRVDFRFGGQTDAVASEADTVPVLRGGIVAVIGGAMVGDSTNRPKVRRYDAADADETNASVIGVVGGTSTDA